jgi:large subunit ribosomal protein L21
MSEETAVEEGARAVPRSCARGATCAPEETGRDARYAVFEDSGKQYRAEEGSLVQVDLKHLEPGAEVVFDRVLLIGGGGGAVVGRPTVPGASVVATVECEQKGPKLRGLKMIRHNRSKVRWGHREKYTLLRVRRIVGT